MNGNGNGFVRPEGPASPMGRDNILPAVLEFREETEDAFFNAITIGLDVNPVQFKLAPTYTIYMATRFRASTHYRPELIPEERAIRLTAMLDAVADAIFGKILFFIGLGKQWTTFFLDHPHTLIQISQNCSEN